MAQPHSHEYTVFVRLDDGRGKAIEPMPFVTISSGCRSRITALEGECVLVIRASITVWPLRVGHCSRRHTDTHNLTRHSQLGCQTPCP